MLKPCTFCDKTIDIQVGFHNPTATPWEGGRWAHLECVRSQIRSRFSDRRSIADFFQNVLEPENDNECNCPDCE